MREKQQITYKQSPIRLWADFSAETPQARQKWHDILQVMKGKNLQPRILYPTRRSFRFDGEIKSFQFSSVAQLCPTLWDPMNCSMPGLPVHHQLPEVTQTHIHRARDAIQPSHPGSSPSPPAPNTAQHQSLFQWVNSLHEAAKVLEFQLQHQSFQWTPTCSPRDSQESSPIP